MSPRTPIEHQEAWFDAQLRALATEMDLDIDLTWHEGKPHLRFGMSRVPNCLEDVVVARLNAITAEGNRLFAP